MSLTLHVLSFQVRFPEMTVHWCGASVRTASTCTASSNGSTPSRCSSSAPCADRSGSLRSKVTTLLDCLSETNEYTSIWGFVYTFGIYVHIFLFLYCWYASVVDWWECEHMLNWIKVIILGWIVTLQTLVGNSSGPLSDCLKDLSALCLPVLLGSFTSVIKNNCVLSSWGLPANSRYSF